MNCFICFKAGNEEQFNKFIKDYNRNYKTKEEYNKRKEIFEENLLRISNLNKFGDAKYGINKFSDLSKEEFKQTYLSSHSSQNENSKQEILPSLETKQYFGAIPDNFDWRNHKPPVITAVKNQGQCGSPYAETVAEQIESIWALAGHDLVNLSVQQIVDCDTVDDGCNGGLPSNAYEYVISSGGLESEKSYPYNAQDNTCHFNASLIVASISSWGYVTTTKNETYMREYLYNNGPLSVCVDAVQWQYYTSGIIKSNCGNSLDHCAQITGYGTSSDGTKYWWVRNQWGTDWGENGYLQIERGHNLCGIDCVTSCTAKK